MKQTMTCKSRRFMKCTLLLLMLLAWGTNAFGGTKYIGDETQGNFTYSLYEETDEWGLTPTQYYAIIIGNNQNAENLIVPSFIFSNNPEATATAQYVVRGYPYGITSSNLKTIRFQNNFADFYHFNCPNLTDIYFEGKTPEMNGSYSSYIQSPAGSQITVHLSDKTPEQIVELRTQTGWSSFHKIVKIGEENQKRTIHLLTEHARVKVGNNTYTNNLGFDVDKYSDLIIDVDKYPTTDYQVTSVKLNGREIIADMTYVSGSNNNGHYTYTILGVINDVYLEVKAENLYNSASAICSDGGQWCKEGSSSGYYPPNNDYPIRWLKSEEAPNILIVPDEGCTLDRIYSNSNDVTWRAHDNGNGTFSYKLTANANVSVTFKEMPTTTTWNVITLGGADITATFKNKRSEEQAYTLTDGENAVPDNAQSMTMRIDAELGKTVVVTADGEDLSSNFESCEEIVDYDEDGNPIYNYYYGTKAPIPANKLKAKNWTIGVKDADSQAITWALQAKGDLPEAWGTIIYLDGQSLELYINNQNPSASASNDSPSGEQLMVRVNGNDGYDFNLSFNGQTVISSDLFANGEFVTEDPNIIAPLLTSGTWAIEFTEKPVDVIHFADAEVRRICLINWDTDRDGQLSKAEAAAVTTLKKDENPLFQSNKDITSFDELQYFTGLNSIEEGCFTGCEHLQSIVLPSSIQSIGNSAFSGCKALNGISLPEGVQTIGDYAFSGTNIETFYLPKNVTQIGRGILSWNDKLVSIAVSLENQTFDSRKGCNAIIRKSDLFLMAGCANTVIPEDVKYLFYSAFEGTHNLTEIVLPAGLLSVGQDVFRYCSALTSVVAKMETPVDVYTNELGVTSFTDISAECVLTVPAGKTDAYIAAGWTIKETDTPDGLFLRIEEAQPVVDDDIIVFADAEVKRICVENWDTNHDGELSKAEAAAVTTLKVNSNSVFKGNETITSFDEFQYFTGLARIENSAFNGCKSLKSIIMPKQAQQIEISAFSGCEQLESALLPESSTKIESSAFQNCKAITSIIVPEGVESLGEQCFSGCIQLKSITLPESLKTIRKNAFRRCTSLQQLFIPKNVESIGTFNCGGNTNLVSLAVDKNNTVYESPEGCNAIIEKATGNLVMGCNTTRIPSSVKTLEVGSMYNLISIRKIEIPANVEHLGAYALADCFYVTSVVAKGETPPTLDEDALSSIGSNCVLTVPYGKTKAYRDAGWGDGQEDSPTIFKAIVEDKSQYDVNRDGEMNITDVTTLVNKILGK